MPPPSKFGESSDSPLTGIEKSVLVTPGTDDLAFTTRAILVDVSGTVTVTYTNKDAAGNYYEDTIYLVAGIWHPMKVQKIKSGGTATGIHIGE